MLFWARLWLHYGSDASLEREGAKSVRRLLVPDITKSLGDRVQNTHVQNWTGSLFLQACRRPGVERHPGELTSTHSAKPPTRASRETCRSDSRPEILTSLSNFRKPEAKHHDFSRRNKKKEKKCDPNNHRKILIRCLRAGSGGNYACCMVWSGSTNVGPDLPQDSDPKPLLVLGKYLDCATVPMHSPAPLTNVSSTLAGADKTIGAVWTR